MSDKNRDPRSVKQIGDPEHSCRVYLEDYANAYIRRIPANGPQGIHAGALYGTKIMQDGRPCYYIYGAAETEPVWEEGRLRFGRKAWQKMEENRKRYFPTMELCGWFVRAEEDFMPGQDQLQRVQDTFFTECGELVFAQAGEDGQFFRNGQSLLYPLTGYFIFYQNNPLMQEYLAETALEKEHRSRLQETGTERWKQLPAEAVHSAKAVHPAEAVHPVEATRPEETKKVKPESKTDRTVGWQRRAAAAVLFFLLAAGIVFYGKPERAKALQQLAERLLGVGEEIPAGATVSDEESETEEESQSESGQTQSETESSESGSAASEPESSSKE